MSDLLNSLSTILQPKTEVPIDSSLLQYSNGKHISTTVQTPDGKTIPVEVSGTCCPNCGGLVKDSMVIKPA